MSSDKPNGDSVADWLSQTIIETSPENEIYVSDWHLKRIVGRPPLREYILGLWQRRHFMKVDAQAKAFSNSRNMFLGHIWLILQPMFDIALYGIIFGFLLKTSRGVDNFVGYLIVGVIFFSFFTKALNGGATLIKTNKNSIRAFPFPRAAIAISLQLRNFLDALPTIVTTIVAIPIISGLQVLSPTYFLIIPLIFFQTLFCLGLIFIAGRLCHSLPDLRLLIQLFTRFWFYGSGIFFSVERFDEYPIVQLLMNLNPAYRFLHAMREVLVYRTIPSIGDWAYIASWSIGIVIFGFIFFWLHEAKYGREER